MRYHNWQKHPTPPGPPYTKKSPNLVLLCAYLVAVFGGSNLGIYVVRVVIGGVRWSTHAYGAALDWGYGKDRAMALRVIDFLIANHEKLGVQMIVDEAFDRTWKCWRDELGGPGWKDGAINGGTWLHIETTPAEWANSTPITQRLTPTPTPTPTPIEDDDMPTLNPPVRIYDSRKAGGALQANEVREIPIFAHAVRAVITVVAPAADGWLTAWGPNPRPEVSDIQFSAGKNQAGFTEVLLEPGTGILRLSPSAACHLIVDLRAAN